jgi:predicted nucleic acid-binding protein
VTLFVDTSIFYAAADSGDRGHERAREVLSGGEPIVTSDHVLVEIWILLRHRLGRDAAERWWSAVREGAAQVESVGPADLEVAWSIGQAFADQDFSIVDRTSFAVMRRLGVYRAASLDRDFAVFRYGPRRDRAFEVVP